MWRLGYCEPIARTCEVTAHGASASAAPAAARALARRDAASDAATVDYDVDSLEKLSQQVSELQTLVRQLATPRRRKRKHGQHPTSARPSIAKRRPSHSTTLRDTIAILDKLDMHDAQRS